MRSIVFASVVLLSLLSLPLTPLAARQDAQDITVTATDYRFEPSRITASPGQEVRVTLVNKGNSPHNIIFKLPGKAVTLARNVAPGQTDSLAFTAPKAGTYVFYCPVSYHASMGMKGTLTVR